MKHDELIKVDACEEGQKYAGKFATLQEAWDACERGDWMLWYAGKKTGEPCGDGRKKLVLACCEVARLALPYTEDARVLACIETAEKWAQGKASIEEVQKARSAAAYAAAYAAYAAYAAAYAAYAADAAAYAAYDDAARKKTLKAAADIVRKHYPIIPK